MQKPLSGGDDGFRHRSKLVNPFNCTSKLFKKDVKGHYGCVNSVEFSHTENLVVSGGDDLRVVLWSVTDMILDGKPKPIRIMEGKHLANVFAHAFSNSDDKLFSGGNDGRVIMHDVETGNTSRDWYGSRAVYNIASSPVDEHVFSAARESGIVMFYDTRSGDDDKPSQFIKCKRGLASMYSGQFNPVVPHLFAVASDKDGVSIYDTRSLKTKYLDLSRFTKKGGAMYAEWNSMGTGLAVNQQHTYPLYIDLVNNQLVKLKDKRFENFHTVKSITFGEDDWILGGSDDFNIYGWQLPQLDDSEKAYGSEQKVRSATIFQGHRSIVNHVRYSKQNKMMMSCGVEKIIKLWSPFHIPGSSTKYRPRKPCGAWGASVESDGEECVEEDTQMLRYFDGLILDTRSHRRRIRNAVSSSSSESDSDGGSDDVGLLDAIIIAPEVLFSSESPSHSESMISDIEDMSHASLSMSDEDEDDDDMDSDAEPIDEWPPRPRDEEDIEQDGGSEDNSSAGVVFGPE